MTEQQLAEIEQRWASNEVTMQTINDFNLLLAEVRKLQEKLQYEQTCHAEAVAEVERLNRMVDRAIEKLSEFGCVTDADPCPGNYVEVGCAECVRKYLESEVADK